MREYAIKKYIEPARKRGETTVRIVAGDVERALGLSNRSAQVCSALRTDKFLKESHVSIEKVKGPAKQMSTTTEFTYRLLDTGPNPNSKATNPLSALYGIAKGVFAPGEWEASIRYDREHFYGSEEES